MHRMTILRAGPSGSSARTAWRDLAARAIRAIQRTWLKYCISSTERCLNDCEATGIADGHVVDEWRWDLHDMRLRLAELEGQ